MLDSFPESLFQMRKGLTGDEPVRSALLSTSRSKNDILRLRNITSSSFAPNERESLYSDLTSMAEAYGHDWDAGSDTGDDE